MLARFNGANPLMDMQPVADGPEIVELRRLVQQVHVSPVLSNYIVKLVQATREHPDVELGASPRATMGLYPAPRPWPPSKAVILLGRTRSNCWPLTHCLTGLSLSPKPDFAGGLPKT